MNATLIPLLLVATAAMGAELLAAGPPSVVLATRPPTSEQLQARRTVSENPYAKVMGVRSDSQKKKGSVHGPTVPRSLLDRSTVLSDGRNWTIVPFGAVLTVPEQYRSRVNVRPTGKLQTWSEFYRRNSGWLHSQPVTMAEASGKTCFSQGCVEAFRRTGRVVVATLRAGPISVAKKAVPAMDTDGADKAEEHLTVNTRS